MTKEIVLDELDDLLSRTCSKLQLNKTRREKIETSYNALCNFIDNNNGYFSEFNQKDFYPQGSYKIQTTVKPKGKDEFDLDFILEINETWKNKNPMELLQELYKLFNESDLYRDKVELKNRCVRINYSNDFHIDILPSFSAKLNRDDTNIKVPDRELKDWTDSNPQGYAKWFNEKSNLVDKILLEKKFIASVEKLPEEKPYEFLNPLNRAVQLIKRYRDMYYKDKKIKGVRSIIITTLCAKYYNGEISEYIAINNIINEIKKEVIKSNKVLEVYNPVNSNEKFSEKWDSDKKEYKEFCDFILNFAKQWNDIMHISDFVKKIRILQELFGENIISESYKEQAQYIAELRENNKIKISTVNGNLIIDDMFIDENNYKRVENHTFYGEK